MPRWPDSPIESVKRRCFTVIRKHFLAREDADAKLHLAVASARRQGVSWELIGDAMDISRQAATKTWGRRMEES